MEGSKLQQLWQRVEELARSVYARKAVVQGAGFFAGLLCSRGLVFGKYAPFGVAAVAAMPQEGLWASALGSFLGYLLPSPAYVPVRYCAALLAVAAIRWSLSELKTVNTHPLFAPAVAFLPLLLTGMTMVFLHGSVTYSAALYVAESFLGCGSAYFLRRCANLLLGLSSDGAGRGDALRSGPLEPGDIAALTVAAGVLALSCSGVTVSGVSLGRISMILLVLTCARSGDCEGGNVSRLQGALFPG